MATTRKKTLSRLSPERSSKNETAADGGDRFESVVETVVERVFSRLKSELMSSVNAALGDFRRAFDDRLKSVEATCNELSLHVELQSSARNAEIDQLRDRVSELESAVASSNLDANLVLSGIVEDAQAVENTKAVVLHTCKEVLGVDVEEDNILEVARLGRTTRESTKFSPRPILVKTRSKHIKTKIMAARKNGKLKNTRIFLNDDLTREEQQRRKQMVPIFRDLRSKGVRCHFERSCLVVGGKRYFDLAKARTLQTEPTPLSPRNQNSMPSTFSQ